MLLPLTPGININTISARDHALAVNPWGANIRSRANLLASTPPLSSAMAPTMANSVCARMGSTPDAVKSLGYFHHMSAHSGL